MGDFYPLSAYSTSGTSWMGWQFHRDELGEGLVQAFRRQDCADEVKTFLLQGLDPSTEYVVTDRDTQVSERKTGRVLMEQGWTFTDLPGVPRQSSPIAEPAFRDRTASLTWVIWCPKAP